MVWVGSEKWQLESHKIQNFFWMDRFEVTQKEIFAMMGNNFSFFKGEDHPVEKVTWYDAKIFLKKRVSYCRSKGSGEKRHAREVDRHFIEGMKTLMPIPGIKAMLIKNSPCRFQKTKCFRNLRYGLKRLVMKFIGA
jgi:hypothetical protein